MMSRDDTHFNPVSMTVRARAETGWAELEARLKERGATLGWQPPLSARRTIGDLLEHAADGLRSPLYGDIRQNCVAVTACLADGTRVSTLDVPRSAAGPDWKHLLYGGRGEPGRMEAVTLRVYPVPQARETIAFRFEGLGAAVEAIPGLLHRGATPATGVLVPRDTSFLLFLAFEGRKALARARLAIATRACERLGGQSLGPEPARRWLEALLEQDPSEQAAWDRVFRSSFRVDVPWSRLVTLLQTLPRGAGETFTVAGFRHTTAAVFVALPDSAEQVEVRERIEALGGVVPFDERRESAVGSRMARLSPLAGAGVPCGPRVPGGDRE